MEEERKDYYEEFEGPVGPYAEEHAICMRDLLKDACIHVSRVNAHMVDKYFLDQELANKLSYWVIASDAINALLTAGDDITNKIRVHHELSYYPFNFNQFIGSDIENVLIKSSSSKKEKSAAYWEAQCESLRKIGLEKDAKIFGLQTAISMSNARHKLMQDDLNATKEKLIDLQLEKTQLADSKDDGSSSVSTVHEIKEIEEVEETEEDDTDLSYVYELEAKLEDANKVITQLKAEKEVEEKAKLAEMSTALRETVEDLAKPKPKPETAAKHYAAIVKGGPMFSQKVDKGLTDGWTSVKSKPRSSKKESRVATFPYKGSDLVDGLIKPEVFVNLLMKKVNLDGFDLENPDSMWAKSITYDIIHDFADQLEGGFASKFYLVYVFEFDPETMRRDDDRKSEFSGSFTPYFYPDGELVTYNYKFYGSDLVMVPTYEGVMCFNYDGLLIPCVIQGKFNVWMADMDQESEDFAELDDEVFPFYGFRMAAYAIREKYLTGCNDRYANL